jgi:YidC/Oxa1 family membrane protein insertase
MRASKRWHVISFLASPTRHLISLSLNQAGDPDATAIHQRELAELFQKYDCHPVKSLAPMLVQGPLFIMFFLAIKRMAVLPSFSTGGALWFENLSIADPTGLTPLLSAATFLATVEARIVLD